MPKRNQHNNETVAPQPVQVELALLEVLWRVAQDNISDYFASRAEVHRLNVLTAFSKPDAETDKVYI